MKLRFNCLQCVRANFRMVGRLNVGMAFLFQDPVSSIVVDGPLQCPALIHFSATLVATFEACHLFSQSHLDVIAQNPPYCSLGWSAPGFHSVPGLHPKCRALVWLWIGNASEPPLTAHRHTPLLVVPS